jgi:hypothetical protein
MILNNSSSRVNDLHQKIVKVSFFLLKFYEILLQTLPIFNYN